MMPLGTAKAVVSGITLLLLAASPAPAADAVRVGPSADSTAESLPPPAVRNGNVWAGRDHQPSRARVESAEQNAGETTPRAEQHLDNKVDSIMRQLQETQRRYPPGFLDQSPR